MDQEVWEDHTIDDMKIETGTSVVSLFGDYMVSTVNAH